MMSIDYAMMSEKLVKLMEDYARLHEEISKIAEYTACLDIFWDGDANSAFMSLIGDDMVRAGILTARIGEAAKALRKAFDIYVQNEKEVLKMIGERI
ncbi:MAG: hypothetical protein K6F73_02150 [Lachnospiraceae bacterium]|nr:hypothetical protein [Lachnospiraceae bacterium]